MDAYSKNKRRQIMSYRVSVRKAAGADTTGQQLKAQLARHLAQQPESKQVFHTWMKVLEVAGMVLVAGAFAVAMYVSINWTSVPQMAIPTAWLAFPVSVAPLMIFIGVHAIGLRAFCPIVLPGKSQQFVTGSKAVASGCGLIVTALVAGGFWGTFAWAVWSGDMALIGAYVRILGTAVGIAIPVAIVASLFQKLFRFR
jgi:hypothetical protein